MSAIEHQPRDPANKKLAGADSRIEDLITR